MKKIFKIISLILVSVCIISCKKKSEVEPYRTTIWDVYHTTLTLTMYNEKKLEKIEHDFINKAKYLHYLFDRESDYISNATGERLNNLWVINENYGSGNSIAVDEELYDLLKLSLEMTRLTKGYFNPAMGSLIDLWQDKYSSFISPYNVDPSQESIEKALTCVPTYGELESILIFDDSTKSIRFNTLERCDGQVILSLGAIGKGFAMDKLKEFYLERESSPALIDGGSSSLISIGTNPLKNRDTWTIGVQAPYPYNGMTYSFVYATKGDFSVSTSGNSEQYFFLEDADENPLCRNANEEVGICDETNYTEEIRRHHILNPYTGYPMYYWDNITIASNSRAAVLDALTTALFNVSSISEAKEIINDVANEFSIEIEFCFSKFEDGSIILKLSDNMNKKASSFSQISKVEIV